MAGTLEKGTPPSPADAALPHGCAAVGVELSQILIPTALSTECHTKVGNSLSHALGTKCMRALFSLRMF